MKSTCIFLMLLYSSTASFGKTRGPGFWRVFQQSCEIEFDSTYSKIPVDKVNFCDCIGRGFVKYMTSDKRNLLDENEKKSGKYLRFKNQLYAQGFGEIHKVVTNTCEMNTKSFKD
jgi:hypothetical protein